MTDKKKQYIGKRMVVSKEVSGEKTPGGLDILKITLGDGRVEHLSSLMFDKCVTEDQQDDTKLRDLRVRPVVEMCLNIMREFGIKVGELPNFSIMLSQSLEYNNEQALLHLLSKHMPKPLSLDDVDMLTVDRILKTVEQK